MSLCYGNTGDSLKNRQCFLRELEIDYRRLICANQIHGSTIALVCPEDAGKGALLQGAALTETDAFITRYKNLPLAVYTADCLPVFLYDPFTSSIGLVHAGWRGSKDNITGKAVQLMRKRFNADPENLLAGFGPAIRFCCYEVGKEFISLCADDIREEDGILYLDLAGINIKQLLAQGVRSRNICDPGICTVCQNDTYFSFRKEGSACGRIMSVIMLR